MLLTLKFSSEIEPVGGESANQKQNKKVQILHQAMVIAKWVESFDSQNVNDFFLSDDRKMNPQAI